MPSILNYLEIPVWGLNINICTIKTLLLLAANVIVDILSPFRLALLVTTAWAVREGQSSPP